MFVSGIFICTPFIVRPIWWDKSAILCILRGDSAGASHFLVVMSRHLFCQISYLSNVSLFITLWLLLQFLKQYPRLLYLGQHLLSDPFKSGGGFSDPIGLRKTFLQSLSGDRIKFYFLSEFCTSSALESMASSCLVPDKALRSCLLPPPPPSVGSIGFAA